MLNKILNQIKIFTRIIYFFFLQIGIDIIKIKNLLYIPKYFLDIIKFKLNRKRILEEKINYLFPIFSDFNSKSADIPKHYFYQDLIISSSIYKRKPLKHVDVGSRIDGLVAQVASFRKIEVLDIRSNEIKNDNIIFKKMDINRIKRKYENYTDSLSCLHTLEHIGLGRYGDPIEPNGYLKTFENLVKMLKKNGYLYISFPISSQKKVFFNSERRFTPIEITKWSTKVKLIRFDYIDDNENIFKNINPSKLSQKSIFFGCGIYTFVKK